MKKYLLIVPILIAVLVMITGTHATSEGQGIKFHEGTWAEALKKAKKENKLIFLDISASWCGPCKMLKRTTFPNAEVGAFYNKNFINVEVDGEVGEGIILAQKYRITGYPSLIYIDKNERAVLQTAGYRPADMFIKLGEQAIGNNK